MNESQLLELWLFSSVDLSTSCHTQHTHTHTHTHTVFI